MTGDFRASATDQEIKVAALVGLLDAAEELAAGDYICYPADQPHIFKALEPDTHALLVAEQN